ncbi:hypothetical protein FHS18_002779 [Paenibacillus phyllosphaerae]|uniref:Uncharacterized protein n=1 Tax=Paenibacillus phyllosphaerae TaxID=274593 RepID=A0A7W5FN29_9BACL|nr:hypothetical protein [Paenibacillus phyllosphaerae]
MAVRAAAAAVVRSAEGVKILPLNNDNQLEEEQADCLFLFFVPKFRDVVFWEGDDGSFIFFAIRDLIYFGRHLSYKAS